MADKIKGLQQSVLTRHLLTRGPTVAAVIKENLKSTSTSLQSTKTFVLRDTGLELLPWLALAGLGFTAVLSGIFGVSVRRRLLARLDRLKEEAGVTSGLLRSTWACLARYAPQLVVLGAISAYLTPMRPEQGALPFITVLAYGLLLYFLLTVAIRILLSPCKPAKAYLPLAEELTRALAQRLQVLALLLLVGFLLFATLLSRSLPEPLFLLSSDVYAAFLVLNLVWITWLVAQLPGWRHTRGLGLLLSLALVSGLAAQWLGFRELSLFLITGLVSSLLAIGLAVLASYVLAELFDGLDDGRFAWQRRIRAHIGLKANEYMPGINWLRLLSSVVIWGALAVWLLRIWGLSDTGFALIKQYFTEGFELGGITITPSRLLWAVVAFALLLTVTRWFKERMEHSWLARSRMERGAREALVTTTGYVGTAVALLVTLSIAGIQLTNLAIIAGALSVGIGFGLQNVVNNFVSGLILLFERPIRTGDWVVVGGTEGYVRRISIRSTQIETFDRADVIVPNSELLSNQVTNWMLSDPWGRVRVPIGVAYGSDTAKVKQILLEVARNHPLVLNGHPRAPDPNVLFLAFGDSSLNFELRCIIREVDRRLSVLSDLNFAIDAAFRENGIEIPFPQRDLHVRDWGQPPAPPVQPPGA